MPWSYYHLALGWYHNSGNDLIMTVRTGVDMGSITLYTAVKPKLGAYVVGYPEGLIQGYYNGRIEVLGHQPFKGDGYDDGYNDGNDDGRSQFISIGISIATQQFPPIANIAEGSFAKGQAQGIAIGQSLGFDEGYDEGLDSGRSDGFVTGLESAPASTGTSSIITVIASPIVPHDPLIVSIYNTKAICFYHVTCQDGSSGPRYTVWDPHDGFFAFPFDNTRSSVTGAGTQADPYIFTIYRLGGWPTGIALDVRVRAVDNFGNESEA
jgi:hypothetical protein